MNILATAAELAAEKHGFGLDLNPLTTNLINIAILVGVLYYFGSKTLNNILSERRNKISLAIREAEENQKKSLSALSQAQEKLKAVQSEAQEIIKSAQVQAESVALEIANQADLDIVRLQESAVKDLSNEETRVLSELRHRIAKMAIEKAQEHLQKNLDGSTQDTLIERSIAQLGGK
jgi:F-type H+-transporting ATPase subunit b